MKFRLWVVVGIGVLLMAIGPAPRYLEELRIGGGFGDADGGADFDAQGNITTDGDIAVDGGNIGITADADLLTLAANLLTVAGDVLVDGGNIGITADADLLTLAANLLTVAGDVLVDGGDIGITADTDLLGLASNRLTLRGDFTIDSSGGTSDITMEGVEVIRQDGTTTYFGDIAGVGDQVIIRTNGSNALTVNTSQNVTISGSLLTVGDGVGDTDVDLDGAAGNNRTLRYKTGGSSRFDVGVTSTAESGSNAGTNYFINSFTDAGAFLATPFQITRSTGLVFIGKAATVADDFTVDASTLFVDSTNNRVGVGLITPATDLHVKAAAPTIRIESTAISQNTQLHFSNSGQGIDFTMGLNGDDGKLFIVVGTAMGGTELMSLNDLGGINIPGSLTVAGRVIAGGTIGTFADADTTPSVIAGNIFKLAPSVASPPITVTALDGGVAGQTVTLIAQNSDTDLNDASTLKLSAAWTPDADDTLTLVSDGMIWFETSRSAN